jgi:hypothetical protein
MMEKEEKFLIPKSKEEQLSECLDYLEETRFNFACFTDSFKRYLIKAGILTKEKE